MNKIYKTHPLLSLVNEFAVDSPLPSNINYIYNFGSLLTLVLVIQILTGIFLAMHYTPSLTSAFDSVEHIMRDVNSGWLIRYAHANGASFFFVCVYIHIGRGLYYGSYTQPRMWLWNVGIIIYFLMVGTAFLGYVLPWGIDECPKWFNCLLPFNLPRTPALKRIGPHNEDVFSVLIGNILGDGWAEKRVNSTRFHIHMSSRNVEYLMWLHSFFSSRGYCSPSKPKLIKSIQKGNKVYFSYRFRTWSYVSFNWIHSSFYINGSKQVPPFISDLLTPMALAIWIQDDGGKHNSGMILSTYNFNFKSIELLQGALLLNFDLHTKVWFKKEGPVLFFPKSQMPLLSSIVKPLMLPSMLYKLNNN